MKAHEHFKTEWEAEESDVVEEEDTVVALEVDVSDSSLRMSDHCSWLWVTMAEIGNVLS